jgi:hypothetical protein
LPIPDGGTTGPPGMSIGPGAPGGE